MGIFDFFKGDSKKKESKNTLDLLKSKIWDLESHYSRQFGLEKVTKDSLNSIQFHDDGKGMLFISKNINLEKPEFLPFNYTLNHLKLIKIFEDGHETQENIDRIDEEFLIVYSHETKNKRTFKSKNPREELKKADSSGILESLFDKSLPSTEIPLDDSDFDSKNEVLDDDNQSVEILTENFQRDVQQYSEVFDGIIATSESYMKNHNSEYPSIEDVKKIEEKEEFLRNNYLKEFEEKKIPLESFYEIIDDTYEIMMLMEELHKKLFKLYDNGEIQAPMTPQLYYEYFSATSLRNSVFQTLIIINNDKKFKKILNELDESQSNKLINNIGKYMNNQPYIGYNYIQDKSENSTEMIPDDSESDESTNGVSDEVKNWTIYSIELSLGLKISELFCLKKDEFNPLYNLEISIDVSESIGVIGLNEYLFLKSLVKCIDELNKEDENWKLNDSDENRLYDLRYNSIIHKKLSKDEYNKFLSNVEKELELIISVLSNKLNDYDNLKKEIKFQGYDMFKKIISKSQILSKYIQNLIIELPNKTEKKESHLKVSYEKTEDIGIVTHYNGNPLTGVGYRNYKNSDTIHHETNMVEGLKHGIGKTFNKNGDLDSWEYFKDDMLQFIILFDEENSVETIYTSVGELSRVYQEEQVYFLLKQKDIEDARMKFSLNEILDDNFNEKSENYDFLVQSNYSFMEMGLKNYLKIDKDELWIPRPYLDVKDGKSYHDEKIFSGVHYDLYINGKLNNLSSFENGLLNGVSKKYSLDGELTEINYWIGGKYLSCIYDPSGLND